MFLEFDKTKCVRCGECIAECVLGVIAKTEDGYPSVIEDKAGLCHRCGHCVAVCPQGIPLLDGQAPQTCQRVEVLTENGRYLDSFLKGRRAIRRYSDLPVSDELLAKAIEYANYAPTAHNHRQVAYIVINGRSKVEKLLESTVAHMERQGLFAKHVNNVRRGRDTLFRGAPCLVLLHAPDRVLSETDCATAASYLELSLQAEGLGSCWAGMMIEACTQSLPEGLVIPEKHKLYAALMVGIPSVKYRRIPRRNPPEVQWE